MLKKTSLSGFFCLLVALGIGSGCSKKSTPNGAAGDLQTELQKVSYILGYSTGKNFTEQSVDIDQTIFLNGLKDGLSKEEKQPRMTEDQMRETMQSFRTNLMADRKKKMEEAGVTNQKEGEAFLALNKTKPNVVTLPSGLQYKIVTAGTGTKPTSSDSVTLDYTGTLLNGKVFDSTEKRGKPATFPVATTIPGMSEALLLMPAGSTWEVYIPANIAYGTQGAGSTIGPNQVLIFKLHLISVEKTNAGEPGVVQKKLQELKKNKTMH